MLFGVSFGRSILGGSILYVISGISTCGVSTEGAGVGAGVISQVGAVSVLLGTSGT